ncbi:MAG: WD40/YVTN/BNR-like repeat-containing protein, partial [Acidobacteriota bacterium]
MRVNVGIVAALALLLAAQGEESIGQTVQPFERSSNEIYSPKLFAGLSYRMVGPSRGGRVTAVAGHRAQPSTFYMGATGGGVWKTTDFGQSWYPISDGYFATGSIGAIRVADSDPDIVYVATGS